MVEWLSLFCFFLILVQCHAWKEELFTARTEAYLKALPYIATVNYELRTADWRSGPLCGDLKRKILILVHFSRNYTLSNVVHVAAIRLDNEIDNKGRGFYSKLCPQDKDWTRKVGWDYDLNVTFSLHDGTAHTLIFPPARKGDCMIGEAVIPKLHQSKPQHNIPKTIYTVYRDSSNYTIAVMEKINQIRRIMNPDWNVVETPINQLAGIVRSLEGDRAARALEAIQPKAFKTDLYRQIVLYHRGGVWMDSKLIPLVPLDAFLTRNQTTLFWDVDQLGIQNTFLAMPAGDLFAREVINASIGHIESHFYGQRDLEITGPQCLLQVWKNISSPMNINPARYNFIGELDTLRIFLYRYERNQSLLIYHQIEARRVGSNQHDICHYGQQWRFHTVYYEKLCHERCFGKPFCHRNLRGYNN